MINLTTLGRVRVTSDQEEITELMRQKLRLALFVYLAVEGETSREGVAGMFWRDRDPDRARHSLSQTLYGLRQTVGDGWLSIHGDRMTVTQAVRVDVRNFEQLVGHRETGRALESYAGPFLGTFTCGVHEFDHWADRKRAHLDRIHRRLRKEEVDGCIGRGDLAGALAHARLWVSVDPVDDEAQHQFIELLAASGERSNAIRQYEIYSEALAADDLTPLDQTKDLLARIRSGEPVRLDRAPMGTDQPGPAPTPSEPASPGKPARPRTRIWGAAETSGPRLVRLIEGGREGQVYPLTSEAVRIGRGPGDIRFAHDPLMSALHASVRPVKREGGLAPVYVIKDEGSRNGVFVRIHGDRPVRYGDTFAAGKQVFQFDRAKTAPEPPEPQSDGPGAATRLGLPEDFL